MCFFKVAKITKLLHMMEKEEGSKYRGKSIGEISINVDDLVSSDEYQSEDEEIDEPISQITSQITSQGTSSQTIHFSTN